MTACDGAQGHPILPACLSTVRCGRRVERWLARCEILVRQRDLVLRRLELGIHPEPSRAERRLDRLHAAIDACAEAVDLLEVAAAPPEEWHPNPGTCQVLPDTGR